MVGICHLSNVGLFCDQRDKYHWSIRRSAPGLSLFHVSRNLVAEEAFSEPRNIGKRSGESLCFDLSGQFALVRRYVADFR